MKVMLTDIGGGDDDDDHSELMMMMMVMMLISCCFLVVYGVCHKCGMPYSVTPINRVWLMVMTMIVKLIGCCRLVVSFFPAVRILWVGSVMHLRPALIKSISD